MIPLLKFQHVFALAVNLGQLHKCVCGLDADVCHHALSCFKSTGQFSKHFSISDIIQRALAFIAIFRLFLSLLVSVVLMAHSLVGVPQYHSLKANLCCGMLCASILWLLHIYCIPLTKRVRLQNQPPELKEINTRSVHKVKNVSPYQDIL